MKKRALEFASNNAGHMLVALLILVLALSYGIFQYSRLSEQKTKLEKDLEDTLEELESARRTLELESEEKTFISQALVNEQNKNQEFAEQIGEISDTVGVLDKLAKTDPELLQKYSRVYFLNEHYSPSEFQEIDEKYLDPSKSIQHIHANVWPFLENLLEDAEQNDINLRIISAFRSFDEQSSLKSNYLVTYGSGANQFSADQGYSEHQLGTTLDFTTLELGSAFTSFPQTQAYQWLLDNAYRYGFILSYPKDNAFYQFEPWHWRFVGKDLARYLNRQELDFYDADQREIDEFLVGIFD